MEIILSKNAGFCPGVRRADNAVQKLIESSNSDSLIFTLGPLIHNGNYVRDLEAKGVKSITISDLLCERYVSVKSCPLSFLKVLIFP